MKNDNSVQISLDECKKKLSAAFTVTAPYLQQTIMALLYQYPALQVAILSLVSLHGYKMALKQEEVNEFVEFLRNNQEKFRENIINSKEFQDGFIILFEDYLKMRTQRKRDIAKKILLGFTVNSHKPTFELERLDDALLKISEHSLKQLILIKKEILPLKKRILNKEIHEIHLKSSNKNYEWWFDHQWRKASLSRFILQWLKDNYDPESEQIRKKYNVKTNPNISLEDVLSIMEQQRKEEIYSAIYELVSLGIIRLELASGKGGASFAGGATFDFSDFGYRFLEYIDDVHVSQNDNQCTLVRPE